MVDNSIAVILATYNGDRYLSEQLDSIAHQSRRPDELIVGDDNSTDDTLNLLNKFASVAPFPVHILHHNRVGVGGNFLSSLESSQSHLIAFSDQDDVWHPQKLEKSVAAFTQYGADLVLHGAEAVDEQLRPKRTGYSNVRRARVNDRLHGNLWYHGYGHAMLFRRSLLQGCDWAARPRSQWSDMAMNHDDLVGVLAAIRGKTVRIPDRLVQYRQHGTNVAGAPQTLISAVRNQINPEASVTHRVNVAQEWADYFPKLVDSKHQKEVLEYFKNATRIMSIRAQRFQYPKYRAIPSLGLSGLRGHYSQRTPDGINGKYFLQDALWLAVR